MIKDCLQCKKEFKIPNYREKTAKFCCKQCFNFSKIGKPHGHKTSNGGGWKLSEEAKSKISKNREGLRRFYQTEDGIKAKKRISEWSRKRIGMQNGFFGKKHSEEIKRHWSLIRVGKMSGSGHPMWKGGVTPIHRSIRTSISYKKWRKSVFERDDYTCVWCGKRGGELNADHIKAFSTFPELRMDISNGRTLCKSCHLKTDTYARKNKEKISCL